MKYIPAEKLIAEVKFAKSVYSNPNRVIHGIADGFRQDGMAAMCDDFLTIIASLQQEQPEVDLEKEIEKYCRIYYNCNYPDQIQNGCCSPVMPHIVEAARHFYELGLNARKE